MKKKLVSMLGLTILVTCVVSESAYAAGTIGASFQGVGVGEVLEIEKRKGYTDE